MTLIPSSALSEFKAKLKKDINEYRIERMKSIDIGKKEGDIREDELDRLWDFIRKL